MRRTAWKPRTGAPALIAGRARRAVRVSDGRAKHAPRYKEAHNLMRRFCEENSSITVGSGERRVSCADVLRVLGDVLDVDVVLVLVLELDLLP